MISIHISSLLLFLQLTRPSFSSIADEADEWGSSSKDVLKLTRLNFESTVFHSGKNGMVKFYQSWRGHSIKMKPTWEELARLSHPSVFIANIDCGAEKELCRSHQITTYPTFRYYKDGVENDYNDARSLEALREFVDTTLSVQCNPIEDGSTCSERALKYGGKWIGKSSVGGGETMLQGEIDRLEKMMLNSDSTTTELMRWIRERRDILKIIKQHKSSEGVHSKKGDKEDL